MPELTPEFRFDNFDAKQREEFWAALALKYTQGLGPRGGARLLQNFGSAYTAIAKKDKWPELGIASAAVQFFQSDAWRDLALVEWRSAKASGQQILLWTNPLYPELLKNTPAAPLFLYAKGNLSLLRNPGVAVVGARNCSSEGLAAGNAISRQLAASGVTIISGLARGIDSQAHEAALKEVGSTIAVLANGLDVFYPPENRLLQQRIAEQGLLLCEHMPGQPPEAYHFPVRNRLISGLALGVLVVEAAARSGSLITARLGLEYGREVFAIPGKFAASKAHGCHDLIRRGAKPVLAVEDVLIELAPRLALFLEGENNAASNLPSSGNSPSSGILSSLAGPPSLKGSPAKNNSTTNRGARKSTSETSAPQKTVNSALGEPENLKAGNPSARSVKTRPAKVNTPSKPGSAPASGKLGKSGAPTKPDNAPASNAYASLALSAASQSEESRQKAILDLLDQQGPLQADSLCAILGLPAPEVSSQLLFLELQGKVRRYPGMIYALE